jgi:uncharacterized protein YdeI (YjbR/CyaY-like superfamily)
MSPKPARRPLLEIADRAELRAWLEANHATSTGVRIAITKKGGTVTALTYDDAVEEALSFGWIDGTAGTLDEERYTVGLTPRKPRSNWARSNKTRVEKLIAAGLMTPAGMAAIERAKADGSWGTLNDVEALVMPDDLAEALAADPAAQAFWDTLPASARKMAFYHIGDAKRPETRAKRIEKVVAAAREGRRL